MRTDSEICYSDNPKPSRLGEALREKPHDLGSEQICERCQGNGEIVTDWVRYTTAHPGDKGDEAVTECPECDGVGRAPNALRDACTGLLGLLELISARPDVSDSLRGAIKNSHRVAAAKRAIAMWRPYGERKS